MTPDREAIVPLIVLAIDGTLHQLDTVLDTGLTGELTLPPDLIADLGLSYVTHQRVVLADGGVYRVRVHSADVLWGDEQRTILVHASNGGTLIGMRLLYGDQVILNVVDGGEVIITPLP